MLKNTKPFRIGRVLVCLLVVVALAVQVGGIQVMSEGLASTSSLNDIQSDSTSKVSFGVFADTHINAGDNLGFAYPNRDRLAKMLDWYGARGVDAIALVGDLTESGNLSQYNVLRSVLEGRVHSESVHNNPGKPRLLATTGNHDHIDSSNATNFQNATGQSNSMHRVINGYHFITVGHGTPQFSLTSAGGMTTVVGDNRTYSDNTKTWLKNRLDVAVAEDPNKPVFVFFHISVPNTFWLSNAWGASTWGNGNATTFFDAYPQAVTFSGHIHSANNDPRSIWQGKFTAVNAPSLHYYELEGGRYLGRSADGISNTSIPKSGQPAPADTRASTMQGILVEVEGSVVTMKNYDFDVYSGPTATPEQIINQTWVFDVSKPNEFPYTNSRFDGRKGPVFDEALAANAAIPGKIKLDTIGDTSVTVTFDQAVMPAQNPHNEIVHSYKFEFREANTGAVITHRQWTDFYFTPSRQQPTYTQFLGGLKKGVEYELRIYAYGSFQAEVNRRQSLDQHSTQYLTTTFTTGGTPETMKNYSLSFNNTLGNNHVNPASVTTASANAPRSNNNTTAMNPVYVQGSRAGKQAVNLGYWSNTSGGTPTVNSLIDLGTDVFDYNQSFTLAFNIKIDEVSDGGTWPAIISNKDWGSGGNNGFFIGVKNNNIIINSKSNNDSARLNGGSDISIIPVASAKANFVHIAAVYDKAGGTNGTLVLYANGERVGNAWNTNLTGGISGGQRTYIGQSYNSASSEGPFNNGSAHNDYISFFIEDFILQGGAMTADEIVALANGQGSNVSVSGVSLNKESTTLNAGSAETLIATITPANATNKNVTWSSSNSAVATVDNNGRVQASGIGTTTITVTTADGNKKATCSVTVRDVINYGDVNGDGVINAADLTMLRRYIAAIDKDALINANPSFNLANADVNGDGEIDEYDVALLRRYLAAADPSTVQLGFLAGD